MATANPVAESGQGNGTNMKIDLLPTPEELRVARKLKAEKYRNMYLLPRYVIEEDGSKRKLEAGEWDDNSKLYSIFTPLKDMSDFGIGIGMYFTTTVWLGLLLILCAIIQIRTATYFQSQTYDSQNDRDSGFKTIGSASCLDEMRVCLNEDCTLFAGEFQFPSLNYPRYDPNYACDKSECPFRDDAFPYLYDDLPNGYDFAKVIKKISEDSQDRTYVGKRLCNVKRWFGSADFVMMIFISLTLLVLGRRQNREAEELDLAEQTAQDYSVIITDPNPDCLDPDEWKEFFEAHFGPVFMCTVTLDNGYLLQLLKKKKFIENEMRLEAIEEEKYADMKRRASSVDATFLTHLHAQQQNKSYFKRMMEMLGLDPTLEYFTMELLKINMKISAVKHKKYRANKVFVVFNEEHSQRRCLESMCVGVIPAMLDSTDTIDTKYLFQGNLLRILEAPEPSSIQYEYLDRGFREHAQEQLISWTLVCIMLILTYFTVVACFNEGSPILGAILISFWNGLIPEVNRMLVQEFETHHTQEEIEDSFLSKTVCGRWFTSSLLLYIVGLDHSAYMLSPYYIGSIQAVLLADAITNPIVRLMDMGGNFKRHVMAPIAGTDERAKAWELGTDWLLAERYTDLAKTMLMSMFFSAIMPTGYWYSAFSCFISFWVDKYCILRLFRQKPPSGDRLVRITRTTVAIVVLIHTIITAHFYYSWPFDNLCKTKTPLSSAGQDRAQQIGAETQWKYKQCLQVSDSLLPPVGRESWFQDDEDQVELVKFYNFVSILMIVYICITYFGSDSALGIYSLFYYSHEAIGEATDIAFETVESGEGYVPQFVVPGLHHSILACVAPVDKGKGDADGGGLEFQNYLLNWTASKERTGEEDSNDFVDLTPEEKDDVYRNSNVHFDDQLIGLDLADRNQGLLARAKQYIKNDETQAAGTMRMTIGGRARASTIAKKKRDDSTNGGLFVVSEARALVNDAQNTARRFSHMASGIGRGGTTADLEHMAYMHNKEPGNRPISEAELTRRAEAASAAPEESRRETTSSNMAFPEDMSTAAENRLSGIGP